MPFKFSPGHCGTGPCGCTAPSCLNRIFVKGCNGLYLSGASVSVWDTAAKGTLCGSGVTDGSGLVTLTLTPKRSLPLTYYYEIMHSRFATKTGTINCGATDFITLTADAGYYCMTAGNCVLPWPTTLYYSDTLLGAVTLTYSATGLYGYGAGWYGSGSFNYGGCTSPCVAVAGVSVPVILTNASIRLRFPTGKYSPFDPCACLGGGPYSTGTVATTFTLSSPGDLTVACSPFLISGGKLVDGGGCSNFCLGTITISVTE